MVKVMKRPGLQIGSDGNAYAAGSMNAAYARTFILAVLLALPCTWIAISVSDNVTVPDAVRYVISPGTMLGKFIVMQSAHDNSPQLTHSWRGISDQPLDQLGQWFVIAFIADMAFYSMLILGLITINRRLKSRTKITSLT